MTGWRLGYSVWPNELLEYANRLCVNNHSCVNTASQYAGIAALEGPQECVENMVQQFHKRKKLIEKKLNTIKGFKCNNSNGAFYCLPSTYLRVT